MRLTANLAQGRYQYSCDGRIMPVQDDWQLGRDELGRQLLISRRLVGEQGHGIEVRALMLAGLVSECRVTWKDEVDQVNAHYRLRPPAGAQPQMGNPVEAEWTGPNGLQQSTLEGHNRLLFPLMRIFMGPLLLRLCDMEFGCEVVAPDIVDPSQRGKLLAPRVSHRRASIVANDAHIQGVHDLGPDVSVFSYHGDEAERDAHCFVDQRGLLVGYDWPSSTGRLWQVRLRDLEWSPELASLC
ncbi:hypothetical protein PVT68_04640 [Microbulbifer bruguierae]|uniref:Uncharacterized protein n=1 Tax=Microbulbifer bruguierae TaxID=3029061 RepID=A0ABY8NIM8_9GAMM|nr:hypothetical protein [Microbulbifer bruguierae]WGL17582.1 hypothetical protein PVT68_04640 [Microbulbifer bruguierae]